MIEITSSQNVNGRAINCVTFMVTHDDTKCNRNNLDVTEHHGKSRASECRIGCPVKGYLKLGRFLDKVDSSDRFSMLDPCNSPAVKT